MAIPTLETFARACANSSKVVQSVGAKRLWEMLGRAKIKGAIPKEEIFAAGVEAGMKLILHAREGVGRGDENKDGGVNG